MTDEQPKRPPTSGPGSGVAAWRDYAAALTGSPAESWAALSREEIVDLLDSEGAEARPPEVDEQQPDTDQQPGAEQPQAAADGPRRGPKWMVPTEDGFVPERALQQQQRNR